MHTPPQSSSKGPRRSAKQHQHREATQRSVQSDNDVYQPSSQDGDQTPSKGIRNRQRKKSHAHKQSGALSEAGEYSDGLTYKNKHHVDKTRATPIKQQAYAGPTFHQSPAASALPMPSFYSRSVPNPGAIDSIAEAPDCYPGQISTILPPPVNEERRESTPLDFLFDAARQAQTTPNGGSPGPRQQLLFPNHQSPASRSPGPRDAEVDFPFELDTPDRTPREGGSGHSTPFKSRLEAARSPQSTPDNSKDMTEEERKAKTAALKKALMTPQAFDQLTNAFRDTNPFNARNAPSSPNMPMQHRSNPSTPSAPYTQHPHNPHTQYFSQRPVSPNRNNYLQTNNRPPSSSLRNVYDPEPKDFGTGYASNQQHPLVGGSTNTAPNPNFSSIYGDGKNNPGQPDMKQPDTQQGLDDLRKVLNLDLMGRG